MGDPRRADDAREGERNNCLAFTTSGTVAQFQTAHLLSGYSVSSLQQFIRLRDDQRHLSGKVELHCLLRKLKTRSNLRRLPQMSHSTPLGQIQFEEADPHTPVNSQRRLVTPPPVSSKVQRSGLVHIIGKDPPKIPNLFGDDFATIVPDDSQEQ